MIDDVIDPRETRPIVCRGLEMAEGKRIERPWKRNGRRAGLSGPRRGPRTSGGRAPAGSPAAVAVGRP